MREARVFLEKSSKLTEGSDLRGAMLFFTPEKKHKIISAKSAAITDLQFFTFLCFRELNYNRRLLQSGNDGGNIGQE